MNMPFLRSALFARCVVSLLFAGYLAAMAPSSDASLASALGRFSAIDGCLALAIALFAFFAALPTGAVVLAAVGGIIRVAVAIALWRGPGAADFAVTVSLYSGIIAALGFVFGVLECVTAHYLRKATGRTSLSIALTIAGVTAAVLGIAGFFLDPAARTVKLLLMIGAAIQAVALLIAAVGSWSPRRAVQAGDVPM
jgi:hypothetical protein